MTPDFDGSSHGPARSPRFVDREGVAWDVRPFEPGDRAPLLETYRDFAPEERAMHLPPVDETRLERWLDDLLAEGRNVVAVRDGDGAVADANGDAAADTSGDAAADADGDAAPERQVVGHAVYTPTDDPEPELALFVHQDYQGRGLGTELCRHVVAAATAADRDALVLDVEASNRTAVGVYERLGFERVEDGADGVRPPAHGVRMRLDLLSGASEDVLCPPAKGDGRAATTGD